MAQTKSFKVVIVGGSVAGLSLANMLQENNIDYVVLEAYPDIHPQVGASIGLLPHGNRILDQLGVFDKLRNLSAPIDTFTFRNDSGVPIAACRDVNQSFVARHGFPIIFLDRQMLLKVLYENIRDKSKVLTGKKVTRVEISDHGSTAITDDGTRYSGDIVVGADGVHSTVRDEMWRLANKLEPGSFDPSEAEDVPCDYNCIFGISSSCPGVNPGDMSSVFRDKSSYLIIGGANGRTYWFRFQKFPKRLQGASIPRFITKSDLQQTVKSALHENIFPNVKFSTLVDNQVSYSMTPLVEHVYNKWYFRRVMTVGDSCHKFHPIAGHGGNAAIETAASLTNLLVEALKSSPSGHLSTSTLDGIFRQVQHLRHDRTVSLKKHSHEQQRTESLDNFFRKIVAHYLLPLADKEDVTFNFSCQIPASEKLDMLPVNRQERLVPFNDELLSVPKGRGLFKWILIAFYVVVAAAVYYGMWILPLNWGLMPQMGEVLTTGTFESDTSFELVRSYTGISGLDDYFVFLAVIFMPGLRGWNPSFRAFEMYFLGLIAQPIVIWTIESYRKRSAATLLAIPSIWFLLFQSTGIGFYMPLYYAVYTWVSEPQHYWWPLRRAIPTHYAKVLLFAGLAGYFLPTALMFYPWASNAAAQYAETFWQPSPLYVPLIANLLGSFYAWKNQSRTKKGSTLRAGEAAEDIPLLKNIYLIIGILGALTHWGVLFSIIRNNEVSLAGIFWPDFSLEPMPLPNAFHNIFVVDFWGFELASYVWCVSAVWDLKRVGRTNASVCNSAVILLVAHLALGPGAAMSAVWFWREDVMATQLFPKAAKVSWDKKVL